uniref:receptor protein serine/threonine kinase n=1 Tax=Ciona savignyi TaxID=51511 RepID=H2Z2R2_CIOSA
MKNAVILIFFVNVFVVVPSWAMQCRQCRTQLDPDNCNSTTCTLDCPTVDCSCLGLCRTQVFLNYTGKHRVQAYCLQQICPTRAKYQNLYSKRQIDGYCDVENNVVNCECAYDDCNHVIKFESTTDSDVETTEEEDESWVVILGAVSGVAFLCVCIGVLWYCVRRYQRIKDEDFESKLTSGSRLSSDDASLIDVGWDESGKHSYSTYRYSSSIATQYSRGSRGNVLNHNEQYLPIELQKIIGRGQFAEVWKANLQQDSSAPQVVSVKVFRLHNYGAWRQEKDMLTESWMRHNNIIEFYASEQHTVRGRLQYWLVTAYYQEGSLTEFLRKNVLDWDQFCDMCISITKGMSYLHAERDESGRPKIPIAHRDVKSCNILVKDGRRECVLADFGLSLKLDPELSKDELANAGQVGTSRYMAPELLERLVNLTDIEMFKRVDVYAMGLVMWEMANRCEASEGMASPYKPPFGDQINDRPTKDQMLLLVCKDRQLPDIPEKWRKHKGLSEFIDTVLNESWEYDAEARITAHCVFERFKTIRHLGDVDKQGSDVDKEGSDVEDKIREKAKNESNRISEVISTVV